MRWRYLAENLYKSRVVNPIPPISAVGNPKDEYEILCEKAPKFDKGWVFVDFDSQDKNKRDLIFFHKKKGNTIYYYRKNRDLLENGSKNLRHEDWASIQMNDVSEWINNLSVNVDDFWYIEVDSEKTTNIIVYGGVANIFGKLKTIWDTEIKLSSTGENFVFFDYKLQEIKSYTEKELDEKIGMRIAKITTKDGKIVKVEDQRAIQFSKEFDTSIFVENWGVYSIWDGKIKVVHLEESITTKLNDIHTHQNKEVLDKFVLRWGILYWWDKNFEAQGEANEAENIGWGFGLYKEKYGTRLRMKSISASGGISIIDRWETLEIAGGMVTETTTQTLVWDGSTTTFTLNEEVYNTGLIWVTTEAGTALVFNVDYTIGDDKRTITFIQPPIRKVFVNYIVKSGLGIQTSWEANTASNSDTEGFGLYKEKKGTDLKFNRIAAGENVSITQDASGKIIINAEGGGWGWPAGWEKSIVGVVEGVIDGVNKFFNLPQTPISWDAVLIFQNGLLQKRDSDYTISDRTITFISAPDKWDEVLYELYTKVLTTLSRISFNPTQDTFWKDWETIGLYNIINTPKNNSTRLWVNGVFMFEGIDYKIKDKQLYIKNIKAWDEVQLLYFYS